MGLKGRALCAIPYSAPCALPQLSMMAGIFPRHIIEHFSYPTEVPVPELMGQLARTHEGITILFMDIVSFTSMAKEVEPQAVMTFLNTLFTCLDRICDDYGVQKVERLQVWRALLETMVRFFLCFTVRLRFLSLWNYLLPQPETCP